MANKNVITLVLNGLEITVTKKKVVILDYMGDVSKEEASAIVMYLFDEGFITAKEIACEIVRRKN